ncbi:ArsR family transcriptional regulator [Chromatiales bacterium (ex Bugula neritina AB1)]|nr:ArsR family transcriptional regulator [Chromatiales bacterium (ex Bugula neritina AB1)]
MSKLRSRGEKIRKFILTNVGKYPTDIARVTASKFDISRQAVNKHLKRLIDEDCMTVAGKTKGRMYKLRPMVKWTGNYSLADKLEEDVVWRNEIAPKLGVMPDNVVDIWSYGFTEILNNAIDHSSGTKIIVQLSQSAVNTQIALYDNGIGIFKKIQLELNLLDERHSVLELAKGKLTTDPDRHTGEGIFFTSRMFDDFQILSGGTYFSHKYGEHEDWILERDKFNSGTAVWMKLDNHTSRTAKKVFAKFTSGDDFGFNKTVVPVKLAQYGDDKLVSRSQAKRLIARFERFKVVILDFEGVDSIGQAFADEVYRVFQKSHPEIELSETNEIKSVKDMILRAKSYR